MNRLPRRVLPELLDELPPDDPRARGSRRDLRRLNAVLRNAGVMAGALQGRPVERLLEIGAGDGAFARRLVGSMGKAAPLRSVALLDRQAPAASAPATRFPAGIACERVVADVFDALESPAEARYDAIVANLFLHHFEDDGLRRLLRLVAARTDLFVACEPRRARHAVAGCGLLPLIGCNDVTRHDARVSVMAGFVGRELSALWPEGEGWSLSERSFPPFGHLFRAERAR